MNLRNAFVLLLSAFLIYSCSSTEGVVDSASDSGLFPSWYSSNGFQSDSTTFSGYGIAIAADSVVAIQRATDEAKKNLDLAIGKLAEDVRTQLVSEGVSSVSNTDFILILRNAHADAISMASLTSQRVIEEDRRFRGFAEVEITKEDLVNQLEEGFNGHPRYWAAFSNNDSFQSIMN
jgi:hypothetical protein